MSRSITTRTKSFRDQRTGNISPSAGHRIILKPRFDYFTGSYTIDMLKILSPVLDPDWYLYDEYDYI